MAMICSTTLIRLNDSFRCRDLVVTRRECMAWRKRKAIVPLFLALLITPWIGNASRAQDAKTAKPASVEEIEQVLDLRKWPVPKGTASIPIRKLGTIMYEAPGTTSSNFEAVCKVLVEQGWKEQSAYPGEYPSANYLKKGFGLSVSASSSMLGKPDFCSITIVNDGNVDVSAVPVPPGMSPLHVDRRQAGYLTTSEIKDVQKQTHELLLAAGWTPYGKQSDNDAEPMLHYRQRAIRMLVWICKAPAHDNKTLLRYSTEILDAELPAPPEAASIEFDDFDKRLEFAVENESAPAIFDWYRQQLGTGWTPATTQPVENDGGAEFFQAFNNERGDRITLLARREGETARFRAVHRTANEISEAEEASKKAAIAEAEEARKREEAAMAEAEKGPTVLAIELPAGATKLELFSESTFWFDVGKDEGQRCLDFFRDQLKETGWSLDDESNARPKNMTLVKGDDEIDFLYHDNGFGGLTVRVSGPFSIKFEPKKK